MNAVGIDVSKGRSMIAALRPMGEVVLKPREYTYDEIGLEQMALDILALGEDTRWSWRLRAGIMSRWRSHLRGQDR